MKKHETTTHATGFIVRKLGTKGSSPIKAHKGWETRGAKRQEPQNSSCVESQLHDHLWRHESPVSTNRNPWSGLVSNLSGQGVPAPAASRGTLAPPRLLKDSVRVTPASSESDISRYSPASSQPLAFSLQDWGGRVTAEALLELGLYGKWKERRKFQTGLWGNGVDDSTPDALSL